eukprot:COSAG06_NODE_36085_length_452_cov_0.509915_2_plen_48_part_01
MGGGPVGLVWLLYSEGRGGGRPTAMATRECSMKGNGMQLAVASSTICL